MVGKKAIGLVSAGLILLIGILLSAGGWALFNLIVNFLKSPFTLLGGVFPIFLNENVQLIGIIVIVIAIALFAGFSVKEVREKVIG